jgi:hypothetical protein
MVKSAASMRTPRQCPARPSVRPDLNLPSLGTVFGSSHFPRSISRTPRGGNLTAGSIIRAVGSLNRTVGPSNRTVAAMNRTAEAFIREDTSSNRTVFPVNRTDKSFNREVFSINREVFPSNRTVLAINRTVKSLIREDNSVNRADNSRNRAVLPVNRADKSFNRAVFSINREDNWPSRENKSFAGADLGRKQELGSAPALGCGWTRLASSPLRARTPGMFGISCAPEVFREGAENGTRGACAPHSTSVFGFRTKSGPVLQEPHIFPPQPLKLNQRSYSNEI